MRHASETLDRFGVVHERHIVSAHRTPVWMAELRRRRGARHRGDHRGRRRRASARHGCGADDGASAGGSDSKRRSTRLDSLLSIVQMPGGVPVGTLAIGKAGATNAGLLAVSILSNSRPELRAKLRAFRHEQTERVRQERLP